MLKNYRKERFLALTGNEFHRITYYEWGNPNSDRTLICLHGLTRNGRDFDFLARNLQHRFRIICPDMPGRGFSYSLKNKQNYLFEHYAAQIAQLIIRLRLESVDLLGTSMGGVTALMLASIYNSPVNRLIMNDVGVFVPGFIFKAIRETVNNRPHAFATLEEAAGFIRDYMKTFGPMTDEMISEIIRHSVRQMPDGHLEMNFDPDIVTPYMVDEPEDLDLRSAWRQIKCPTMLIRGAESPILTTEMADEMASIGPRTTIVEIPETGHAPHLMSEEQAKLIYDWLLEN